MSLPRPEDVHLSTESAKDVLDEVGHKLRRGEWQFDVPNRAFEAVQRELEESGWIIAAAVPGHKTTHMQVAPRMRQHEAQDAIRELIKKIRN